MIDKQLLDMLLCPETHTPLAEADAAFLAKLNHAISAGKIKNRGGDLVAKPIPAGLVRRAADLLYPVVDDIPVLLVDEAICLEQLDG